MDLVTGATGHIGNVLVRQLLARGRQVRALVRPGKVPVALQGLSAGIVPGDLLDPASLERAVDGVETVYHLAARIQLGDGPDPETARVNLDGTRHLLEAVSRTGVRRLVYASSVYALRMPAAGTIDEGCPFDPLAARGEYDRTKAAASLEVQRASAHGLDAVLVCPTAVTGPYDFQPSEAGRALLYNLAPGIKFTINGAYNFVDVRDVAQGMILAAERGRRGQAYILGGERLTVREVAEAIWAASDGWHAGVHLPDWVAVLAAQVAPLLSSEPIVTPYSLGAVRSNADISSRKAMDELGYCPRPARQALTDAVCWFQGRQAQAEVLPEIQSAAV